MRWFRYLLAMSADPSPNMSGPRPDMPEGPGMGSLPEKPGQVPLRKKKKLVNPVPVSPAMESKLPQGTNNTDPNGSIKR